MHNLGAASGRFENDSVELKPQVVHIQYLKLGMQSVKISISINPKSSTSRGQTDSVLGHAYWPGARLSRGQSVTARERVTVSVSSSPASVLRPQSASSPRAILIITILEEQ